MAIKNKTHSGAKKRFRVSKSGKVKARRSHRSHILTKKSPKRKLHLRKNRFLKDCDAEIAKRLIQGS